MENSEEFVTRREFTETVQDLKGWIRSVDGRVWLIVMAIVADAATHVFK